MIEVSWGPVSWGDEQSLQLLVQLGECRRGSGTSFQAVCSRCVLTPAFMDTSRGVRLGSCRLPGCRVLKGFDRNGDLRVLRAMWFQHGMSSVDGKAFMSCELCQAAFAVSPARRSNDRLFACHLEPAVKGTGHAGRHSRSHMLQASDFSSAYSLGDSSALACWPRACWSPGSKAQSETASMQETVDNLGDDDQWECPECEDSRYACNSLTCIASSTVA